MLTLEKVKVNQLVLFLLLTLSALILSGPAFADIVAHYDLKDGNKMVIAYKDDKHIRIETGQAGYMLINGEKAYMVNDSEDGLNVMDMDQLAGLMGAATGEEESVPEWVDIKKTGKTETVAGYKGDVYTISFRDEEGKTRNMEAVFSPNKDVKAATDAWTAFGKAMGKKLNQNMVKTIDSYAKEADKRNMGGMLRSGDDIEISKIERKNMGNAYYEVPAGAQKNRLGDIFKSMGSGNTGGGYNPGAANQGGVDHEELLKQLMKKAQESMNN